MTEFSTEALLANPLDRIAFGTHVLIRASKFITAELDFL
jgi:hypothetical protein